MSYMNYWGAPPMSSPTRNADSTSPNSTVPKDPTPIFFTFIILVISCFVFAIVGILLGYSIELLFRPDDRFVDEDFQDPDATPLFFGHFFLACSVLVLVQYLIIAWLGYPGYMEGLFFITFYFGTQLSMFARLNRFLYVHSIL